jgi:hypothetical protein
MPTPQPPMHHARTASDAAATDAAAATARCDAGRDESDRHAGRGESNRDARAGNAAPFHLQPQQTPPPQL